MPQSTGWGQQGLRHDDGFILTGCCGCFSHSGAACCSSAAGREKGDEPSLCTALRSCSALQETSLAAIRDPSRASQSPGSQQSPPGEAARHPAPLFPADSPCEGLQEGLLEVSGCEGRCESEQQHVGGESSESESREPWEGSREQGMGPCLSCLSGMGAAALPQQHPPTPGSAGCACTRRSTLMATCWA